MMMNMDFQRELEKQLHTFREWSRNKQFQECRLVQYCGVECLGGISVALSEIESQIEGLISEGFCVDWQEHAGWIYLAVWEPPELEWTWPQVIAEQHLADLSQWLT